MNKLIELLKEYAPEDFNWCAINGKIFDSDRYGTIMNVEMGVYVISKQFGFIKWLVDNDKIDIVKWIKYGLKDGRDIENYKYDKNKSRKNRVRYWTEYLLMTLSIQDNPIEFLISILK